jgi:hypothetical protein
MLDRGTSVRQFAAKLVTTILIVALLLGYPPLSAADNLRDEANRLLLQTERAAFLSRNSPPPPYHERVSFTLFRLAHGDEKGEFVRDFVSSRQWRYKYSLPEYQHVEVRNGDRIGEWESADFEPLRVRQLRQVLPPLDVRLAESDVVKKIQRRSVHGIEVRCVEYETIQGQTRHSGEMCVNPANYTVTSWHEVFPKPGHLVDAEWTDYISLKDKFYPRHVELKEDGEKIAEAQIDLREVPDLNPAMFQIPDSLKIRKACERTSPAVRIEGDDLRYPAIRLASSLTERLWCNWRLELTATCKMHRSSKLLSRMLIKLW